MHARSGGREARAGVGKLDHFFNQQRPNSSLGGQAPYAVYWNGNKMEPLNRQTPIVTQKLHQICPKSGEQLKLLGLPTNCHQVDPIRNRKLNDRNICKEGN